MTEQNATGSACEVIPGTRPDKQPDFLYVQAHKGESPLDHLRRITKLYRSSLKAGAITVPKSGLMGTTSWRLRTPEDEMFYALQMGGDREGWLAALRRCAQEDSRAAGQVIGYTRIPARFVLDDGRVYQLADCVCDKH